MMTCTKIGHVVEKQKLFFCRAYQKCTNGFSLFSERVRKKEKNEVFFGADNDDADSESGHHKLSKTTGSYNTNNLLHSYSMLYTVLISLFISLFMDI